jgi:hypothetical protein
MNLKHYKAWADFTDEDWALMKELQYQCLLEVKEKFEQAGVKWWLDFGTSLGCYRDGKILDFDSDCDISLFAKDVTPKLLDIIGPNLYPTYFKKIFWGEKEWRNALTTNDFLPTKSMRYEMKDAKGKIVKVRGHVIFTDLFCWFPLNDWYVMPFHSKHIQYMRMSKNVAESGFKEISFTNRSEKYPILSKIEESLTEKYGDTWSIPDDKFHHDNKKSMKFAHLPKEILEECKYNFKTNETIEIASIKTNKKTLF